MLLHVPAERQNKGRGLPARAGAWDLARAAQALAMCEAHLRPGAPGLPRVRRLAAHLRLYAGVLAQPGARLELKCARAAPGAAGSAVLRAAAGFRAM